MSDATAPRIARRIVMTGRVQGVGYRPFVYRLAHEHALAGHVRNLRGDVEVLAAMGLAVRHRRVHARAGGPCATAGAAARALRGAVRRTGRQ